MAKIIKLKKNMVEDLTSPVVLYDGVCNFCNVLVNFIIRRDKQKMILFAPIQSREARMLLRSLDEPFVSLNTVYLIEDKKVYKRSTAVFKTIALLPYPWKIISYLSILPVNFTDSIYKIIAKHRYRLFGKKDEVVKPDEAVKERFITPG
ncbi:MAG: thiol-disulfide oxidoreductase DCC family protein [Bacteroidetes bacterium]|nr:thiol-disulfide oxidoreductase DCC family protein [Bacteroidota bacterium]